jgi:glycosyltransferase involved in cell wall biosynthesis
MGRNKGAVSFYFLVKKLVERGNQIFLIKPVGERENSFPLHYFEIKNPFTHSNKGYLSKIKNSFLFFTRAYFQGRKILKKYPIDKIMGVFSLSGLVAYFLGIFSQRPAFTHLYGVHDFYSKKFFSPFHLLAHFDTYLAFKLVKDKIIFIDDYTPGEKVRKKLKVPKSKWISFPLGVNKEWMEKKVAGNLKEKLKLKKDTILFLSFSRLDKEKRVSLIIEIIPYLVKERKDLFFLIGGEGSEKERLRRKIHSLGIEKFVRLMPAVPQNEVVYYLKNADYFLSFYRADIGGVLMEAMVCGLPPIVTPRGEIQRLIKNNETGFIISDQEPASMAKEILAVINQSEVRKRIKENLTKFAQDNFLSWEEAVLLEIEFLEKS